MICSDWKRLSVAVVIFIYKSLVVMSQKKVLLMGKSGAGIDMYPLL